MDTIGLIRLSQSGDRQAREQLITENVGLVWSMVRRFTGRGCEAEDLFQIGTIGLIKAIDKFDVSFDVKFSTYAVPMISGEIKRFLRDDGMIKVSRTLKENNIRLRASGERLLARLGRDATLEEIAEDTGKILCLPWRHVRRSSPFRSRLIMQTEAKAPWRSGWQARRTRQRRLSTTL